MADQKSGLLSEFLPVSTEEWEAVIQTDLKGKDYEKALVWKTYEGTSVKPYYRSENLEGLEYLDPHPDVFPFVRGIKKTNDWFIREDIFVSDPKEANNKARLLLNKGIGSLGFYFDCFHRITRNDLAVLLNDINLEAFETNFVCSCNTCNCVDEFTDYVLAGKWDINKVTASSASDPIGNYMLKGVFEDGNEETTFLKLKGLIEKSQVLPHYRVIGIHGKFFGNCGSSIIQELAFALAAGSEYLIRLTDYGLSPEEVARKIKFNFSISNSYFPEIARLRAARFLWARIVEAFDPADRLAARMFIHCETGMFNKTIYDPFVNLLRSQTEAMSAVLGGVHSLSILPFDYIYGEPSEFSERIARNQQLLLKEEAFFNKVADPSAGSYYIEKLTESIIEEAWKLFLKVDEEGGFLAAFRKGFIQSQINDVAEKKRNNLASRRDSLLGTNQFPDFRETMKKELDPSVLQPADFSNKGAEVETLKPFRLAQHFEALRYGTDLFSRKNKRPAAFMLTYGNLAFRRARAQFMCNFFAVGGFEVIDNNGFSSAEEGVKAARKVNAEFIVVCSSDEEYAEFVPQVSRLLKNEILVVAGNPECRPALEEKGIRNFIHIKSNILEELKKFQDLAEIINRI